MLRCIDPTEHSNYFSSNRYADARTMCNRVWLKSCQPLHQTWSTPGLLYYCNREGWSGKERFPIFCLVHCFLEAALDSPTIIEYRSLMKEIDQESTEPTVSPSTSFSEGVDINKKTSSNPAIRGKSRNIDAICASLASSSAYQSKIEGLFKNVHKPATQNGSKEPSSSEGSNCLPPSPTNHDVEDSDIELFQEHEEHYNSVSTNEEEIKPSPALLDTKSLMITSVCSLSVEVPLNYVLYKVHDASDLTEDCASGCSSRTCIEPGSTGSSTVIDSPTNSINPPDSPVAIGDNSGQGNKICHTLHPKSNKELCNESAIRQCHIPTHIIRMPLHHPDFVKCQSKKYRRILRRSEKEIRRIVVKSDEELCQQYGIRPCSVRIKKLREPFTIRYSRTYIAHAIRLGYNEQLHRKRVNWSKVYDKYLAGRCVTLRREYFEQIAQKSVDDWLATKTSVSSKKEAKKSEEEARERRARLIRLKETELLNRRVYYGDEGQYIVANSEDIQLYREAVKNANRLKVVCSNVTR
ncbi:hypothetical protein JTE90_024371 [Oedothorax gibbosus]|uniref:Uncharacterized protein n=1 Tax=Oedothorax gibbosus TaxID=931172 RepID=A0AAV6U4H2_9ARAC|nr:hypothetical protein JTE90_024371 [Oedothorax gibbosus]